MGLDMYLKSAPKVKSIEELMALEIRLSKAYFDKTLEKELKAAKKDLNLKKDIEYEISDWYTKEEFEEYSAAGEHVAKVVIRKEIGYWRKFNALHAWFVENVQGGEDECRPHIVTEDQLRELLFSLANINKKNAKEVLPTQQGFFFGGTGYDEYYWEEVDRLKLFLMDLLGEFDFKNKMLIYRASW